MAKNHEEFEFRLIFIREILSDHLGLSTKDVKNTSITPIQYEPDCPFKYNNFVYRLELPVQITTDLHKSGPLKGPGCVPIPANTTAFVIRLSNPQASSMHPETRVQNEVGILTLASAALRHVQPSVVPRVFGWAGANSKHTGWILQELMPGKPLAEAFDAMSLKQKRGILSQMAQLMKGLQDYSLPDSIKGWGGVTFDDSGAMISGSLPTVGSGPWSSLQDSYRDRLKVALTNADMNPHLRGWRDNGVRLRVEKFIEQGVPAQMVHLASKQERVVVHADFTTDNLLYDPKTELLTALLDYDFASISHPGVEYFRSFATTEGRFLGWRGDRTPEEKEALALHDAKLTGRFPSPLPAPKEVDWEVARAWEMELQRFDAKRPSTIDGINELANMDEILGALSPFRLTNEDFLRMNTEEDQLQALRRIEENSLVKLLDHMGY